MTFDLALHNGLIVTPKASFRANLGIKEGKIVAISQDALKAEQDIELNGQIVFPGVVDLHVHFSEPGREYWEGWETGSYAAAMGGTTTVIDMPLNAIPATTTARAVAEKAAIASLKSKVDFALWGGFVDDNLADIPALAKSGIMGFKAFMVDTKDDTFRFVNEELLYEGMKFIAKTGHFLAVHAEDDKTTWERTAALQKAGRKDRAAWAQARSPEVELLAITKALAMAKETSCPLHIVHVSIPEGAQLIRQAQKAGQQVSFETCPHYLSLTNDDLINMGPEAKCAPPLREQAHQDALWKELLNGNIDLVSSDHSPCTLEEKTRGNHDIWAAWGGITGIQTMLPIMFSEAIVKRNMKLELLSVLLATNPAKRAGLWPRKGEIQVGADADLVIIDPTEEWTVEESWLKSKNPHSPFVNWKLKGKPKQVILRGSTIMKDDVIFDSTQGAWLKP